MPIKSQQPDRLIVNGKPFKGFAVDKTKNNKQISLRVWRGGVLHHLNLLPVEARAIAFALLRIFPSVRERDLDNLIRKTINHARTGVLL